MIAHAELEIPRSEEVQGRRGNAFGCSGALLTTCSPNESSSRAHDVVYLSGYALECSLKAWLMSSTPLKKHAATIAWFKIIKHDLDRLKGELYRKGQIIPKVRIHDFNRVRSRWLSEMRYLVRRWRFDDAEAVFASSQRMVFWVQGA